MIERIIEDNPITCEHCGFIQRDFIIYEDGCGYCADCALANGDIDDDQHEQDTKENYRLYEEWLMKELREL